MMHSPHRQSQASGREAQPRRSHAFVLLLVLIPRRDIVATIGMMMISRRRRATTRTTTRLVVTLVVTQVQAVTSFLSVTPRPPHHELFRAPRTGRTEVAPLFFSSSSTPPPPGNDFRAVDGGDDQEDEPTEPGKMRVSEIKAELELRGVSFGDCFDKESLADRLKTARAAGRADPAVLEQFNKQKLEQAFHEAKVEIRDEDVEMATANDGTLPGGMTPDTFKKLSSNPDVMALLSSTKMQEAMKLMMTDGQDGLERRLRDDPELRETVRKLDQVLREAQ